jgi:hypothetical protein
MPRVKPHLKRSLIEEARRAIKPRLADMPHLWAFNFNYLDTVQGQSFEDWHNAKLLVTLLDHLRHYSQVACSAALNDGKFISYKCFPAYSGESFHWFRFYVSSGRSVATLAVVFI